MKLDIRGEHLELTDDLRTHAERRLQFVLGRFGQRIARVTMHLTDLKGPRGGVGKQCRITVDMPHRLIAEVSDADLYAAIDRAADRLGRTVARELELRRET